MRQLKSERHHWWPVCVSSYWADESGCAHWIKPSGEVIGAPPKNFGVIGNGHHIKHAPQSDEISPWDICYESEFQTADNNFPSLIQWLESLEHKHTDINNPLSQRFHPAKSSDEEIKRLVTCIVSLAIRSPMNREASVRLAEDLRGPHSGRERNSLIGLNMHRSQRQVVESIGTRGKFVAIYSSEREFIYGDGFFHNLRSPLQAPMSPKMLVPITPNICVLYVQPMRYLTNPKLFTLQLKPEDADALNHAVQVYSRKCVFYRSHQPEIIDDYRRGAHREYSNWDNPVDNMIYQIPGVPPRDTSLDFLYRNM